MNDTVPTQEMIENLADFMVNRMSYEELKQFAYDDIYSIMSEDSDVFYTNLPEHLEAEDFTNAKFRVE
tara:strand:- start:361 stop:564 length:204 start_codon:yes stop_codon:yes gene_type:complete